LNLTALLRVPYAMGAGLSQQRGQERWLQVAAGASGSLSSIGNALLLLIVGWNLCKGYLAQVAEKDLVTTSRMAGTHASSATTERLFFTLSACDFVASVCFAFADAAIGDVALCEAQAYGIQFGLLAAAMYSLALSLDLAIHICLNQPALARRLEPLWHVLVWVVTLPVSIAAADAFGDATIWCWIVDPVSQFSYFYYIVIVIWCINAALLLATWFVAKRPGGALDPTALNTSGSSTTVDHLGSVRLRRRLVVRQGQLVLAFNFVMMFGLLNRLTFRLGRDIFVLRLLHTIFVPLWGFLNLLIYSLDLTHRFGMAEAARKRERNARQERVRAAINSVLTVKFSVCFMPFQHFRKAGTLLSHEQARDRHLLGPVLDMHAQCIEFVRGHPTVFFSHQWSGFGHPDPSGKQFELMVKAGLELCAQERFQPSELYVWCDYCSVPQANPYTQSLSIATLGVYASLCEYFVVIAPPIKHDPLGTTCDLESYKRRGWCRLEQWAHLTAAGTERLYVATGEPSAPGKRGEPVLRAIGGRGALAGASENGDGKSDKSELLLKKEREAVVANEWFSESICVFLGDFTVPDDKPKLVDVVLGLWALTLVAMEARHAHAAPIVALVQERMTDVFPERHFGDLVQMLEKEM